MRVVSFCGDVNVDGFDLCAKVRDFLAAGEETMVDRTTHHDKLCVVLDEFDEVVGLFASRTVELIHEFRIRPSTNSRMVAEAMFNYAMGAALVAGHTQGLMAIDKGNLPMLRFIRSKKPTAYSSGEDEIFLIDVK